MFSFEIGTLSQGYDWVIIDGPPRVNDLVRFAIAASPRIWKEANLKPHRLEHYMASNDLAFEQKTAAIIGLYLNPQHAAVFCVGAKSAMQALDRLDRQWPLSPGRAQRHGILPSRDLVRYAALNSQTGELIGQTAARHTSQEFVAFLKDVVATQPAEHEVHVILDNFSARRTALVKQLQPGAGCLRAHANGRRSSRR